MEHYETRSNPTHSSAEQLRRDAAHARRLAERASYNLAQELNEIAEAMENAAARKVISTRSVDSDGPVLGEAKPTTAFSKERMLRKPLVGLLNDLAQVERHIARIDAQVSLQQQIVTELGEYGFTAYVLEASKLLAKFQELQKQHLDQRDKLLNELAEDFGSKKIA